MNADQFATALAVTRADPDSRTSRAARRVLVDGLTANAAAREQGLQPAAVYRALRRLGDIASTGCCPTCGQALLRARVPGL